MPCLLLPQYFSADYPTTGTSERLVQHLENGKSLVLANIAMVQGFDVNIAPYSLLSTVSDWSFCTGRMSITAKGRSHPVMSGVASFGAVPSSGGAFCSSSSVTDASVDTLATWTDSGLPLAATKTFDIKGAPVRRVDLNFYPVSSAVGRDDFWDASTDGGKLLARALLWAAYAI